MILSRLPDDERRKEMKSCRKEEKRLRGEGLYDELDSLVGPKGKVGEIQILVKKSCMNCRPA